MLFKNKIEVIVDNSAKVNMVTNNTTLLKKALKKLKHICDIYQDHPGITELAEFSKIACTTYGTSCDIESFKNYIIELEKKITTHSEELAIIHAIITEVVHCSANLAASMRDLNTQFIDSEKYEKIFMQAEAKSRGIKSSNLTLLVEMGHNFISQENIDKLNEEQQYLHKERKRLDKATIFFENEARMTMIDRVTSQIEKNIKERDKEKKLEKIKTQGKNKTSTEKKHERSKSVKKRKSNPLNPEKITAEKDSKNKKTRSCNRKEKFHQKTELAHDCHPSRKPLEIETKQPKQKGGEKPKENQEINTLLNPVDMPTHKNRHHKNTRARSCNYNDRFYQNTESKKNVNASKELLELKNQPDSSDQHSQLQHEEVIKNKM